MRGIRSTRSCLAILFLGLLAALGCREPFSMDDWLRRAELGPYFQRNQDIAAIEVAAKDEGEVVVWSVSSRLKKTGRAFESKYGIRCRVQSMSAQNLLRKVRYDQEAGGHHADVYLFGDAPEVLATLVPKGVAWPWLDLHERKLIPEEWQRGLPAHHISAVGLIYNSKVYDEPPITSWWDLTTPEWRGKLVTKDLSKAGGSLHLFATFVAHHEELAKEYERRFQEPLVVPPGTNAGYLLIERILTNQPQFVTSGSEAANRVGAANIARPPVGIMTLGKVRYKGDRHLQLAFMNGVRPAPGVVYQDPIGIAAGAPHPNAAKLFIRFAYSEKGFAPYRRYGTWSADPTSALAKGMVPIGETSFWRLDPEQAFRERKRLSDFILEHR